MKLPVEKFDFAKGTVKTVEREVPDTPPSTPLMELLRKQANPHTPPERQGD